MELTDFQKALLYHFVKGYLSTDLTTLGNSDFALGYSQGLNSLRSVLERMEKDYLEHNKAA